MSNNGYFSCQVTDGTNTEWVQDTYTPEFSFNVYGTWAVRPSTMGTIVTNQTSWTHVDAYTYEWTQFSNTYNL